MAAGLVPFIEHDDANRALMGSNMQRQAVPLMVTEAPLVGTGMEECVARDSGAVEVAETYGVVEAVDANHVVIRAADGATQETKLIKFARSNSATTINYRPIVLPGEQVRKGDVIADGPACSNGEIALGRNVIVAFMPWEG